MMAVSAKTLPVSFHDDPNFTKYNRTSYEFHDFLREPVDSQTKHHSDTMSSSKDSSSVENARSINVLGDKNNKIGLHHCSANEMVNVCYAKIWRGACWRLEDEENDPWKMEDVLGPSYFEKDLDKLHKLRLKSKLKTKKSKEKTEVRKWIETPEKFINVLKDIKDNESGVKISTDESNNSEIAVDASGDPASKTASSFRERKHSKNQVHFPEHVLLCGSLQEQDPKEVESIINHYKIDLNSLSRLTGYYYLHKTITNGQINCAKILIQKGIDVNAKDNEGVSAIALAFRLMDFQMVALLVDCGANVNEYTKSRINELDKVNELSRSISKVFEMEL